MKSRQIESCVSCAPAMLRLLGRVEELERILQLRDGANEQGGSSDERARLIHVLGAD